MFKFSSFLKQNKLLFFVILFVITSGVLWTSTVVNAQGIPGAQNLNGGAGTYAGGGTNAGTVGPGAGTSKTDPDLAENANIMGGWTGYLNPLNYVAVLGAGYVDGCYKIAQYSGYGMDYVISTIMRKPITTDKSFMEAWAQIRNLGNMLLVLGFVVVGIATALRIQTYAATKLLWPLILIAFLINFSGLFCGLIIDASNLVTTGLLPTQTASTSASPNTTTDLSSALLSRVVLTSKALLGDELAKQQIKFFAMSWMFGAIYLGMALTFLYLAILLIARYVILIMLYILSPLAFAFWIFPASKKLWTDWWNHFLKWSFVGVFGSFVLWITGIIISQQETLKEGAKAITDFSQLGPLLIQVIIVMGFLAIGFKMTASKTGVASLATTAVMGLASGGAAMALGAVKLGGRGVGAGLRGIDNRLSGGKVGAAVGNMGRKISSSTGRLMDSMAGTPGARAGGGTKEMSEASGRIGSMDAATQAKIAMGKGMSGMLKASDRAAATQSLAKSGKLWMLGNTIEEQARHVDFAENYMKSRGMDTSDFRKEVSKSAPALEAYNASAVGRIQEQHPGWSARPNPALGGLSMAQHEAVVRATARMPEDSLDANLARTLHHSAITAAGNRMNNRKKEIWKNMALDELSSTMPADADRHAALSAI